MSQYCIKCNTNTIFYIHSTTAHFDAMTGMSQRNNDNHSFVVCMRCFKLLCVHYAIHKTAMTTIQVLMRIYDMQKANRIMHLYDYKR